MSNLGTSRIGRGDVWDGDAGRGTRDVKNRDAGTLMIIEKVGGNCNISHFPLEYVLVNETLHPTLLMLQYSS